MSRLIFLRPLFFAVPAVLLAASLTFAGEGGSPASDGSDAISALLTKLKKDPSDYMLNLKVGNAYAAAGQIANAETHYEKARRANVISLEPYYLLAVLYIKNGRYEDAIKISKTWMQRDPKSYYGHFCMADALSLNGQVKESLDELKELQKLYPSDTAILEAMKLRLQYLGDAKELAKIEKMLEEIKA